MSRHSTSVRRVAVILGVGLLVGCPVIFVARHGSLEKSWRSVKRGAHGFHVTVRAVTPFTETARRLREYRVNREKWEALELKTYSYEFENYCFCAYTGRYIVNVVDNEVSSVAYADTGEAVYEGDLRLFDTIDGQFDILRNTIRYGPDSFAVSYDPQSGIPVETEVDHSFQTFDDEGWTAIRLLPGKAPFEETMPPNSLLNLPVWPVTALAVFSR